jgi:subtilisin family serine protease
MKLVNRFCLLLLILVMLPVTAAVVQAAPAAQVSFGRGVATHIVVFKNSYRAASQLGSISAAYNLTVTDTYQHAINGVAAIVPPGRIRALRRDPRVAYVEKNQVWSITAQTTPTGINRIFAPGNPNLDIDGSDDFRVNADVAVIDTGIASHSDLNVAGRVNCTSSLFRPRCVNGGSDGHGHGTHVAGTVGAIDNNIGVVGVAPGVRLWAVKVLNNSGSGLTSWIIAGIDWVAANSATIDVANMSLGCECTSSAQAQAITNAVNRGVVFVVAAGNSAKNASTFSPANHPDVITVSALSDFDGIPGGLGAQTCRVDQDDTLADFSNYGSLVEIAAPGVCILSTWLNGGYNTISGTSMASPHVAGAAALVIATSGKPTNKSGVQAVANALISTGNFGWTDERDGVEEPLLDVSNTTVFNP